MTTKELEDVQLMFSRNREQTVTYIFDKVPSFAHLWLVQGIEQHIPLKCLRLRKERFWVLL